MATKIMVRRGGSSTVPILDVGEPAFATDTNVVYFGDGTATPPQIMTTKTNVPMNFSNISQITFAQLVSALTGLSNPAAYTLQSANIGDTGLYSPSSGSAGIKANGTSIINFSTSGVTSSLTGKFANVLAQPGGVLFSMGAQGSGVYGGSVAIGMANTSSTSIWQNGTWGMYVDNNDNLIWVSLSRTGTEFFPMAMNSSTGIASFQKTPTAPTASNGDSSLNLATTQFVQNAIASSVPSGSIVPFAGPTWAIPGGYLLANGAAVSRTTYANLFNALGSTSGPWGQGDGSSTFNLPDLRGQFLRSLDNGAGIDSGRNLGTAQLDAFQGHLHLPTTPFTSFAGDRSSGGRGTNSGGNLDESSAPFTGLPTGDGTNGSVRTAAETRPRNVAVNMLIKY